MLKMNTLDTLIQGAEIFVVLPGFALGPQSLDFQMGSIVFPKSSSPLEKSRDMTLGCTGDPNADNGTVFCDQGWYPGKRN